MAYTTCEDCGTRTYQGKCSWCHEEIIIEEQYEDLGQTVPESIATKASEHRGTILSNEE